MKSLFGCCPRNGQIKEYGRICNVSFRLHTWWTRLANDPDVGNQDFEFADLGIVKVWLEWLGYTGGRDGFPFGET